MGVKHTFQKDRERADAAEKGAARLRGQHTCGEGPADKFAEAYGIVAALMGRDREHRQAELDAKALLACENCDPLA